MDKGHHTKGHDRYSRDTVVNKGHHSEQGTLLHVNKGHHSEQGTLLHVNKGHHSEQETPQQSRETTANKEQYSQQGTSWQTRLHHWIRF